MNHLNREHKMKVSLENLKTLCEKSFIYISNLKKKGSIIFGRAYNSTRGNTLE
jgi:hypothetical protein